MDIGAQRHTHTHGLWKPGMSQRNTLHIHCNGRKPTSSSSMTPHAASELPFIAAFRRALGIFTLPACISCICLYCFARIFIIFTCYLCLKRPIIKNFPSNVLISIEGGREKRESERSCDMQGRGRRKRTGDRKGRCNIMLETFRSS